jgi:hypothetical protein
VNVEDVLIGVEETYVPLFVASIKMYPSEENPLMTLPMDPTALVNWTHELASVGSVDSHNYAPADMYCVSPLLKANVAVKAPVVIWGVLVVHDPGPP